MAETESLPYCRGTGRAPTEKTLINDAPWGRCPRCRQWRPLYMYRNQIKPHVVVAGLVTSPGKPTP